jgi:hypothetical protein
MKTRPAPLVVMMTLGMASLFLFGCKPKSETVAPTVERKPPATTPQTGLSNMSGLVFDPDPAHRPVVISKPASNRREWALKTLEAGYRAGNHMNAAWDRKVMTAFEAFADFTRGSIAHEPALLAALDDLAETGCDDPMVQYMRARYGYHGKSKAQSAIQFGHAHDAMLRSQHHPLFKFMAGMRAVDHARMADTNSDRKERISWTTISLVDAVRDTNAPADEMAEIVGYWLAHSRTKPWAEYVMNHVGSPLRQNWMQTPYWSLIMGRVEIDMAWASRGGGYSYKVTEQGWEDFSAHLAKAEEYLTDAWSTNPTHAETAYLMMRVELGQGNGLDRMEQWFKRTMALSPNHYHAAKLMSFYLEPRWYGTDADAIRFARSCVASDEWGGSVPLVLADLHRSLAKYHHEDNPHAYWRKPQVWQDMKASWEKFFQINPRAVRWRYNYARDAFTCEQYADFLQQTKLFGGVTNFTFFGGEQTFNKMLQTASTARTQPAR